MTYSSDLRRKVLEKLEQGYSIRQTAELFGIHFTTVRNWKKQPFPTTPKPPQVRPPKKISKEALLADVEAYPTDYLYERAARFGCTAPSIRQALIRYGISRKKTA